MSTYTMQPSATPGYTDLLEDGRRFMSCPEARAEEEMARHIAFMRDYWLGQSLRQDETCVRTHGTHYRIGAANQATGVKGFAGARWRVRFFDGRVVETDNLWHQGDIPEAFRGVLSDNATLEAENLHVCPVCGQKRYMFAGDTCKPCREGVK